MLRRCAVLVALIWLGLTSRAGAIVSVVLGSSDPDAYYLPGETITLTVLVTANGGETDDIILGETTYPDQFFASGSSSQTLLPGNTWNGNPQLPCFATAHRCNVFSQLSLVQGATTPVAINVTDFQLATLTLNIRNPSPLGVIEFSWVTTPSNLHLDFFGVTSAPGYSVTIIPEPATSALLCAGLLGLVIATRRRI